jgi:parvulin-like peptidyl-prolyl isomerase
VARVNGEEITRSDLADECLRHYGEDVLERLVNKYLIMQECRRQGITVSQREVDAEIQRMASRFGLPIDQWLKMLQSERGITPTQYANDIIWPTLALQKLAGERLVVSEEELRAEHETQFGPAVKARLIVCTSLEKAQAVRAQALADPDNFGNLAKQESVDPSASTKGLINPIRRHMGHVEIEQAAFALKEGEISEVVRAADQYVILKCEGQVPGRGMSLEQARPRLEELVREKKLRGVAGEVFQQLQEQSSVQNVLNDPVRSREMPGVAAVINGHNVTLRELAQLCMERHGVEVLEGTVNRRILEHACKKRKISITPADIDQEILEAAGSMVPPRPDGSPDVEAWLKLVTEQQGVSQDVYRRDSVWPSVALRKLVDGTVEVTEEDLQRGFEANYGPRVRCLAIVLDNHRRAQEVWEKARANPSPDFFGDLSAEYSIEPGSRALRGEVPPIQKYGGQPLLEKEAFALAAGELSGIIQVDRERYVILKCVGQTTPVAVEFAEVRDEIHKDIREKKLRMAMADHFVKLQDEATIDNFLAGTTQSPTLKAQRPETPLR